MRRHFALFAVWLASLGLMPATAAAADALTLEVPAVTAEETAVRIVARGEESPDRRLSVFTEPGSGGCAATAAEHKLRPAATEHTYRFVAPGAFMDVITPTFEGAGPQTICGYLASAPDRAPAAAASASLTVRRPVVALSIKRRGDTLRLAGSSEVPRKVFVYVAPRGSTCSPTAERMAGRRGVQELLFRSVTGSFRQTISLRPAPRGRLVACAYVSEAQDANADVRRSLRLVRRPVA